MKERQDDNWLVGGLGLFLSLIVLSPVIILAIVFFKEIIVFVLLMMLVISLSLTVVAFLNRKDIE